MGSLVPLIGVVGLLVLVAVGAFVLSRRRPRDASAAPWAPPATANGWDGRRDEPAAPPAPAETARPRSRPAGGRREGMAAPDQGQGSVATQPSTCPACGGDLAPGTRFCPSCGRAVS